MGISIENIIPPQASYCVCVGVLIYIPSFSGQTFLSGALQGAVASWEEKSISMQVRTTCNPFRLDLAEKPRELRGVC